MGATSFDIIVVGASIAGLYSGAKLAEAGYKVGIADRRQKIGVPVRCAEATGNRAELARFVDIDESFIARDISGLSAHIDNAGDFERTIPNAGVILSREKFEQSLANRATNAGASLMLETDITGFEEHDTGIRVVSGKQPIGSCSVLVGADGAESRIGRLAGITSVLPPRDAFPSAQYRLESEFCNDGNLHFFIGSQTIPQGYLWVFPSRDGTISVGAGIYGCNKSCKKALHYLDTFIADHLPTRRAFDLITGCVPLAICPKKLHAGTVVTVGDAARQCNPLTAGGIMNTLESADLLAKSLTGGGDFRKGLAAYSRKWAGRPRWEQRVFGILKDIVLKSSDRELSEMLIQAQKAVPNPIDRSGPFTLSTDMLLGIGSLSGRLLRKGLPRLLA